MFTKPDNRGRVGALFTKSQAGTVFTDRLLFVWQKGILPAANEVMEGNVFTCVCQSVRGGGGTTKAGGTHPTGILSCQEWYQSKAGNRSAVDLVNITIHRNIDISIETLKKIMKNYLLSKQK